VTDIVVVLPVLATPITVAITITAATTLTVATPLTVTTAITVTRTVLPTTLTKIKKFLNLPGGSTEGREMLMELHYQMPLDLTAFQGELVTGNSRRGELVVGYKRPQPLQGLLTFASHLWNSFQLSLIRSIYSR
jgi:hypothetical protein